MKKIIFGFIFFSVIWSSKAVAEEWCTFKAGYHVITHGMKTNSVWVNGYLEETDQDHWVEISNEAVGTASVSIALAASFANKRIQFYVDDSEATCDSIARWYSDSRHIRAIN